MDFSRAAVLLIASSDIAICMSLFPDFIAFSNSLLKFAAISWNSSHRRLSNGRREE
jgi:hypothetical protein